MKTKTEALDGNTLEKFSKAFANKKDPTINVKNKEGHIYYVGGILMKNVGHKVYMADAKEKKWIPV